MKKLEAEIFVRGCEPNGVRNIALPLVLWALDKRNELVISLEENEFFRTEKEFPGTIILKVKNVLPVGRFDIQMN